MKKKSTKAHEAEVKRAAERSLERALKEERTAIAAITKCFLLECPSPERALARIEAMVRAADANPRTTAATRRTLIDGATFVRTAIERELGKPQSLFDPHVGHVKGEAVDKLVQGSEVPEQLGLAHDGKLGDTVAAHEERTETLAVVQNALVDVIRTHGAMTDAGLWYMYSQNITVPRQSAAEISARRKELTRSGRLRRAGSATDAGGVPKWDLVERALMGTES